jgi:hypothetical protein
MVYHRIDEKGTFLPGAARLPAKRESPEPSEEFLGYSRLRKLRSAAAARAIT